MHSSTMKNAAKTSFRRINPRTGCLSRKRFSPVLITKNNESQLKYWLLIRYDAYHRNWVVQLEIRTPEGHAITERTLSQRDCNLPKSVIEKLGQLYTLMASAGAKNLDRLLQGKVSFGKGLPRTSSVKPPSPSVNKTLHEKPSVFTVGSK